MRKKIQPGYDSDADVVLRVREGDIEAFGDIVRRYEKKMLNIAYRVLGDYEESLEAVQDAFISAFKNIKRYQGRAKFSTWLYTIMLNTARNYHKKLRNRTYHEKFTVDSGAGDCEGSMSREPASEGLTVLERLEKSERDKVVHDCMNSLSPEFREVAVLRDIQGFSYTEIGDMLSIAEGTVKSRLSRARDAIKNCLKGKVREARDEMR